MQIGEFAKICNTRISVLRHYDKEGLLVPDYTDRFTGYRYYSREQIADFFKISALKAAGFSLSEIKNIISNHIDSDAIMELFEAKRAELKQTLSNLAEAKKMMLGANSPDVQYAQNGDTFTAKLCGVEADMAESACEELGFALACDGFQRISVYRTLVDPLTRKATVECDAVKLCDNITPISDCGDIPFEDDESIVGKWEIIGEFAVREDFYTFRHEDDTSYYKKLKAIYFLPGGAPYWCYSWTCGRLIIKNDWECSVNSFDCEDYMGERYMFVELKSYNFRRGGRATTLVLRRLDNKAYTTDEIAQRDDINIPFEGDADVLGKWIAVDFCRRRADFNAERDRRDICFYRSVEFMPDGELVSKFANGAVIANSADQSWTRGYVLDKINKTACAYEIVCESERGFLLMEWKSGDYIWGGLDPGYYVFMRE